MRIKDLRIYLLVTRGPRINTLVTVGSLLNLRTHIRVTNGGYIEVFQYEQWNCTHRSDDKSVSPSQFGLLNHW